MEKEPSCVFEPQHHMPEACMADCPAYQLMQRVSELNAKLSWTIGPFRLPVGWRRQCEIEEQKRAIIEQVDSDCLCLRERQWNLPQKND